MLEVAVVGVKKLSADAKTMRKRETVIADARVGGSIFAGFTKTFGSAYLLNTALFLLLFAVTSTFLYLEQASAARHAFKDRAAQTEFFATVDLMVNVLTLAIQLFLTGRILRVLGVTLTLALLPAVSILGFGVLAVMPTVAAIVVFQVIRRAGNFAIARPTRELLFTVVPREDRYKAKSFIDTVVYRFGDQLGAWSSEFFRGHGVGNVQIALVAIPLSILWLIDSLWLGRRQSRMAAAAERALESNAPAAAQSGAASPVPQSS